MHVVGGKSISHHRTKMQLSLLSPSFSSQPVQGGKLPRSLKLSGGVRVFRSLLHKRQLAFHHLSGKYSLNSESDQISDIKSEILEIKSKPPAPGQPGAGILGRGEVSVSPSPVSFSHCAPASCHILFFFSFFLKKNLKKYLFI